MKNRLLLCACVGAWMGLLAALGGCRSEYGWWTTEPALPVVPTNTVEVAP